MGRGDFPPWLDSVQSRLLSSSRLLYPVVQVVLAFVHLQLSFSLASPRHKNPHKPMTLKVSRLSRCLSVFLLPLSINGFLLLLLFVLFQPHKAATELATILTTEEKTLEPEHLRG